MSVISAAAAALLLSGVPRDVVLPPFGNATFALWDRSGAVFASTSADARWSVCVRLARGSPACARASTKEAADGALTVEVAASPAAQWVVAVSSFDARVLPVTLWAAPPHNGGDGDGAAAAPLPPLRSALGAVVGGVLVDGVPAYSALATGAIDTYTLTLAPATSASARRRVEVSVTGILGETNLFIAFAPIPAGPGEQNAYATSDEAGAQLVVMRDSDTVWARSACYSWAQPCLINIAVQSAAGAVYQIQATSNTAVTVLTSGRSVTAQVDGERALGAHALRGTPRPCCAPYPCHPTPLFAGPRSVGVPVLCRYDAGCRKRGRYHQP